MIIWNNTEEYLYGKTNNFKYCTKIASFDLDGTIIVTLSKKKFPVSHNDWEFFLGAKEKLQSLSQNGYCLIIVSNQAGLRSEIQKTNWMLKLETIQQSLNLELLIFCSLTNNEFRKPLPMFFLTETFFPQKIYNDKSEVSFYCGDACGRIGDHANTDLKFAQNCGLNFFSPEMLFNKIHQVIPEIVYPDINMYINTKSNFKFEPSFFKEIIIMVGYPASGKSTIANSIASTYNYVIANQDTLKTKSNCLKFVRQNLSANKSVVVDNTNRDKKTRNEWISLAKKYNYKVRCILITIKKDLAMHNNVYRNLTEQKYISKIVYNTYNSQYEEPTLDEGFDSIIYVDKIPQFSEINYDLYSLYLY